MSHSIIKEKCTGCSACSRQCPSEAISGVFLGCFIVDEMVCIECGLCGEICPEGAVLDPQGNVCERVARVDRPRPVVNLDICNACGKCVSICPAQCRVIFGSRTFEGHSALLQPGLCRACGACERVCAKGAVKLLDLEFASEILRAADKW